MAAKHFHEPDYRQAGIASGAGLDPKKVVVHSEDNTQIVFMENSGGEQKFTVQDLEDLGNGLENAVNCLEAIHDAMTAGNATADQYTDGLFFCMIAIKGYSEELTEAVRTAYKQAREERLKEGKL